MIDTMESLKRAVYICTSEGICKAMADLSRADDKVNPVIDANVIVSVKTNPFKSNKRFLGLRVMDFSHKVILEGDFLLSSIKREARYKDHVILKLELTPSKVNCIPIT